MDIFISYAHIDNEPLVEEYPGWVTAFHRVLEKRLRQLLGEEPSIWRDTELRGNDLFDDEIADRFRDARLFISVVSPRYVRSDYCQKELREFLEAAGGSARAKVGNRSRVIKVIKTPVGLEDQPESIRPMLGYAFFQEDPETRRSRELAAYPPTYRDQFLLVLDDLAQEISDTLVEVRRSQGAEGANPASAGASAAAPATSASGPPGGSPVIYLATATSDLEEARGRLRRFLQESGVTVLPDRHLPLEVGAFEEAVRGDLARCRMSIHLVGERYAFAPEGSPTSSTELQLRLASERNGGLRRLIWMPPGLASEDPRQRELIERLRDDPDAQRGAQLFATRLEALEGEIEEALRPEPEPVPAPEAPPGSAAAAAAAVAQGGPVPLYLIYDLKDLDAVRPLEDLLWDLEGADGEKRFEVFARLLDGDEAEVRADHEDNLRSCDAFLVYYGEGGERWLRQQLSELRKARGLRGGRPVRAEAVYVAPPSSTAKERFRSNQALVIRGAEEPAEETLAELLAALDSPEGGAGS
jgi:hypothetical protein